MLELLKSQGIDKIVYNCTYDKNETKIYNKEYKEHRNAISVTISPNKLNIINISFLDDILHSTRIRGFFAKKHNTINTSEYAPISKKPKHKTILIIIKSICIANVHKKSMLVNTAILIFIKDILNTDNTP